MIPTIIETTEKLTYQDYVSELRRLNNDNKFTKVEQDGLTYFKTIEEKDGKHVLTYVALYVVRKP